MLSRGAGQGESPHDLHILHSLPAPGSAVLNWGVTALRVGRRLLKKTGMTDVPWHHVAKVREFGA
jgi:hypothetical protein